MKLNFNINKPCMFEYLDTSVKINVTELNNFQEALIL